MEHQLESGMFTAPRPPEPSEAELAILAGVKLAQQEEHEVDEMTARLIASQLHSKPGNAVRLFATSGRIDQGRLYYELAEEYERQLDPQIRGWIDRLACFCIAQEGHESEPLP